MIDDIALGGGNAEIYNMIAVRFKRGVSYRQVHLCFDGERQRQLRVYSG